MLFDVYYPIKTKDGSIRPGVKPNPKDWNWIRNSLITDIQYVSQLNSYRETGDKELKASLPSINFVGRSVGSRRKADMIPTQLFMIDIDAIGDKQKALDAWTKFQETMGREWIVDHVVLAHMSPSYGIHIIFKSLGFKTLQENMDEADKLCNFGQYGKYDSVCKDFSRVSFIFTQDDILFENALLFLCIDPDLGDSLVNYDFEHGEKKEEATPAKEEGAKPDSPKRSSKPLSQQVPVLTEDDIKMYEDMEYRGTPLKVIVKEWLKYNGTPGPTEVHNYYNEMVKYFRHITSNDRKCLFAILPRFDHEAEECWSQVVSITRVNTLSRIDYPFFKFLTAKGFYKKEDTTDSAYKEYLMSDDEDTRTDLPPLPPVFREFVRIAPKDFQVPVINALMPILGTLASYVKAQYPYDSRWHTTSFFSIIYAGAGVGKGFVERPIELLFEEIKNRDAVQEMRENIYLRILNKKGTNERSPDNPHTSVRIIPPKNSESEFLDKQCDNKGYHMFTYAAEMDSWAKGARAAGGNKDDMIRIAWDNGEYGQQFKSPNTFKGKVNLYWNVLITGTLAQLLNYYKNVENGLVTRCCFTAIENQEYQLAPRWKNLTKKEEQLIRNYAKKCDENTYRTPCTIDIEEARVMNDDDFVNEIDWRFEFRPRQEVELDWIMPVIDHFHKVQCEKASLALDNARDTFRRRVGVRGFRLALLCTTLYRKVGPKEKELIKNFVAWWMNIDLESSLKLWGDRYNKEANPEIGFYNRNVFAMLNDEFDKSDLYVACTREGIKSPLRTIIFHWKKSGHIVETSKGHYKKTEIKAKK